MVMPVTEIATLADTQTSTLPGQPEPHGPPPSRAERPLEAIARAGLAAGNPRHRRWTVPGVVLALSTLTLVSVAAVLPSQWFVEKENRRLGVDQPAPYARVPASAQSVDDLVTIGDLGDTATEYPPSGDFYMVTVMAPSQTLLSWLMGRDHPAVEFLTAEDKNGPRTPQQNRVLDQASMRTSEQVAQYVALERLGYDVDIVPGEVLISQMVCLVADEDGSECLEWSPSDEVLDPGDRIVSIDGEPIETIDDLSALLEGREPGDVVAMEIVRPGRDQPVELDVSVELTASPEEPNRTIVGFYPFDTAQVELPFEMRIDPKGVGGPSAGLAFTLTIIDDLTEGELTGGRRVAVTGSIELDGSVGRIGGLRQKASAVAQMGIDLFLVPASQDDAEIEAARQAAGDDLEIVPVGTLDEALAVLEERGGDPVPAAGALADG